MPDDAPHNEQAITPEKKKRGRPKGMKPTAKQLAALAKGRNRPGSGSGNFIARGNRNFGKVVRKGGNPDLNGRAMAKYRQDLSLAVRGELDGKELRKTLRVLIDIRDDIKAETSHRIAACRELLDRMLGKPKVEAELTVAGEVSVDQRVILAKLVSGLVVDTSLAAANQPSTSTTVAPQLPFIDSVADVRPAPAEDVGDLLHLQPAKREVLHREFEPNPHPADGASPPTELGDAQEPEAPKVLE